MKKLIIVNGTMGVGKTAVCGKLYKRINGSVWLDGDWCWMINPFVPSENNRKMAIENMAFLLNSFIRNPEIENIIFCWVIHLEEIFEEILGRIDTDNLEILKITLLCSRDSLIERMEADGRKAEIIEKSLNRLRCYEEMDTLKIDTTDMKIEEIVCKIMELTA